MATPVTALVPMRHHSERVPGKNYRLFAGKPLYRHVVEALLECTLVNEVIIDTDSPVIAEDAAEQFPSVRVLDRPEHLRAGTIPMNDILLHDIENSSSDIFLQTHSTNPLLRGETIERALRTFLDSRSSHDSLFSVTTLQTRLWNGGGRPLNHDPDVLLRTQDLPPVYEENSCIYIFPRTVLTQRRNRIGRSPYLFAVDRWEAVDIDEEFDFVLAEQLYHLREAAT